MFFYHSASFQYIFKHFGEVCPNVWQSRKCCTVCVYGINYSKKINVTVVTPHQYSKDVMGETNSSIKLNCLNLNRRNKAISKNTILTLGFLFSIVSPETVLNISHNAFGFEADGSIVCGNDNMIL